MQYSRRELCYLVPAMLALKAQASSKEPLPSKVYTFSALPVKGEGANEFRPVFEGKTHDGYPIELHETDLAPGSVPHPPHHHSHEEIFMVREGTLTVTINGHESSMGPGGVAYINSNDEHGIRNSGSTHARYFVFALGQDQ
jgi:mannose-6-phosphate isomerase-like protein (cupin superfamily)